MSNRASLNHNNINRQSNRWKQRQNHITEPHWHIHTNTKRMKRATVREIPVYARKTRKYHRRNWRPTAEAAAAAMALAQWGKAMASAVEQLNEQTKGDRVWEKKRYNKKNGNNSKIMYNFIVPDLLESQSKLTRRAAVAKAVEQRFGAGVRAHAREWKKIKHTIVKWVRPTAILIIHKQWPYRVPTATIYAISCPLCLCFLLCVSRFGFVYQFIVFVESFGPFICCL